VATDTNPNGLAVDQFHNHVYVANITSGDVSQYSINADGSLTPMLTPTVAAGAGANAVTLDPTGSHAYVPNSTAGTVSQYTVAGDGSLTPMTPAFVTGSAGAAVMAINPMHPTNAYVVNYTAGTVSHFTIAAGALTFVADSTLTGTAPINPNSLVIDPTGTYLYVADEGNGTIAQFSIDPTTGVLTPLTDAYITQGAHSLTLHTSSNGMANVYAPNSGSTNLVHFQIGAGGDLGAYVDYISAGAADPISIAFDPTGNFAYSADYNSGNLSQFTVDANGTFTGQGTLTLSVGGNPAYMVTTIK
jgi:DNA-binding beta-propeller fold protein YncE